MNCPRCATENPPGAKFCRGCGVRLDAICSACRHSNIPGSRFCNECGGSLVSDAHALAEASSPSTPADRSSAAPVANTPQPTAEAAPRLVSERRLPSDRAQVGYTPKHLADKILKARSALEG